jgi:hypothetical protein
VYVCAAEAETYNCRPDKERRKTKKQSKHTAFFSACPLALSVWRLLKQPPYYSGDAQSFAPCVRPAPPLLPPSSHHSHYLSLSPLMLLCMLFPHRRALWRYTKQHQPKENLAFYRYFLSIPLRHRFQVSSRVFFLVVFFASFFSRKLALSLFWRGCRCHLGSFLSCRSSPQHIGSAVSCVY